MEKMENTEVLKEGYKDQAKVEMLPLRVTQS